MNNGDLISRSALLAGINSDREAAKAHPQEICERFNRFCDYAEVLVEQAPAIDAVEVVRCRDCRLSRPVHREDGSVFEGTLHCSTGRGYQQNVFGREYSVISPDSFCAAGKRKMNAEVEG